MGQTCGKGDRTATVEHRVATERVQVPASSSVTQPAATNQNAMAVKIWVIYYSTYGHVRKLAHTIKEGLQSVEGVEVSVYQVAETLPAEVLAKMHAPPKNDDPVIDAHTLGDADAFVFGFPTRFGTLPAQFKAFLDATGSLWTKGTLMGKPYAAFTSTASQHGGQETTIASLVNNLTHHGAIFVPCGFFDPRLAAVTEVTGGSAWGPATIAGADGSRQPSEAELDITKAFGAKFAAIAKKLAA